MNTDFRKRLAKCYRLKNGEAEKHAWHAKCLSRPMDCSCFSGENLFFDGVWKPKYAYVAPSHWLGGFSGLI